MGGPTVAFLRLWPTRMKHSHSSHVQRLQPECPIASWLGFHQVPLSAETARPFVHVQLCLRGEVPVRTSGLADAKRSF